MNTSLLGISVSNSMQELLCLYTISWALAHIHVPGWWDICHLHHSQMLRQEDIDEVSFADFCVLQDAARVQGNILMEKYDTEVLIGMYKKYSQKQELLAIEA